MPLGKCLHISPETMCSPSASGRNRHFNWHSDFFGVTQFIDDWMKSYFRFAGVEFMRKICYVDVFVLESMPSRTNRMEMLAKL